MTDRELMQQALEIEKLAERFSEGWHEGIKIDALDIELLLDVAAVLRERLAQPEMQPCAGRNCGSTNPNLHSAECFEDYEKATGMNQWQRLTDEEINSVCHKRDWTAPWTNTTFARAVEQALKEKNT